LPCKICEHPKGDYYTRLVLLGRMTLAEAAAKLGVSDKMLWYHIKNHVKAEPEELPDDLQECLQYMLDKLKVKFRELMLLPTDHTSIRSIAALVKEMRGLIMDLAKLQKKISTAPSVNVTVMTKLETGILTLLCPECKQKVLSYLEAES